MDPTRFVSSLRENRAQYIALLARAARLTAVASGKAFVPPPELIKEAPDLVEQERSAYESKRMELDATVGVASQQLSQRLLHPPGGGGLGFPGQGLQRRDGQGAARGRALQLAILGQ